MNDFTNGKILVIDDNENESKPICDFIESKLNRLSLSITGYDGLVDVEKELTDVDMIFLDLHLNSTLNLANLRGLLKAVKERDKTPYILFVWTKNITEFEELKTDILNDDDMKQNLCMPYEIISLDKNDYLDMADEIKVKSTFNRDFNKNCVSRVKRMKGLIFTELWRKSINDINKEFIHDIINLIDNEQGKDDVLSKFLNTCAHSYYGKRIQKLDDPSKKNGIYPLLSSLFYQKLCNEIPLKMNEVKYKVGNNVFKKDELKEINSYLQIFKSNQILDTGSLFRKANNFVLKGVFCDKYEKFFVNRESYSGPDKEELEKVCNGAIFSYLVITPACQIAQMKNDSKLQVVPCVLLDDSKTLLKSNIKEKYFIKEIYYNGKNKLLYMQFNLSSIISETELTNENYLFTINSLELIEIKHKLTNFLNGIGKLSF